MFTKVCVEVDERTRLLDLDNINNDTAFWGLLLHAGYLSANNIRQFDETMLVCNISIPNYEVRGAYALLIKRYQERFNQGQNISNAMIKALLAGDIDGFTKHLQKFMEQAVSFHDIPKKKLEANNRIREQVYHAFLLGLLAGVNSRFFKLSSNREAGYGRYDTVLMPKDKSRPGLVFEIKATDSSKKLQAES